MHAWLQSLWTPLLEKHVAGLTSELMQKIFDEVRRKCWHLKVNFMLHVCRHPFGAWCLHHLPQAVASAAAA
jgi:hypothetical protein